MKIERFNQETTRLILYLTETDVESLRREIDEELVALSGTYIRNLLNQLRNKL